MRGKQGKLLNQAVVKALRIHRGTFRAPEGIYRPLRKVSKSDLRSVQHILGDADLCSIRRFQVSGCFEQIPGTQTTYEQTQRSVLWWDLDRPQRASVSPLLMCHPETHLGSTGVMGLKHLTRCAFNSNVPENAKHCY